MRRRPDSHDEFELALDEVMTVMQLGNCDLVRCAARADGGVAARLSWAGTRALAIPTREAYGVERYIEVRKAA